MSAAKLALLHRKAVHVEAETGYLMYSAKHPCAQQFDLPQLGGFQHTSMNFSTFLPGLQWIKTLQLQHNAKKKKEN